MSDFSQSQNKIWYWFFFSQILNPKGIEIFWLLSRFLYILLLVWLFKFVSLNSWHSSLSIDFAFYIICFHSAEMDFFLTMDVSDIQFYLHIRFCRITTSDMFPWPSIMSLMNIIPLLIQFSNISDFRLYLLNLFPHIICFLTWKYCLGSFIDFFILHMIHVSINSE